MIARCTFYYDILSEWFCKICKFSDYGNWSLINLFWK